MKTNFIKKLLVLFMAFSIVFSNATIMSPSTFSEATYDILLCDEDLPFIPPISQ